MECSVCCLPNVPPTDIIKCVMCNFECCKDCIKRYILEGFGEGKCMNCNGIYTKPFLMSIGGKGWVTRSTKQSYKSYITNMYLDKEKSKIPDTITKMKDDEKKKELLDSLNKEINILFFELNKIERTCPIIKKYYYINRIIIRSINREIEANIPVIVTDVIINEDVWNIYPYKNNYEPFVEIVREKYRENKKWPEIEKIHNTIEYKNYTLLEIKYYTCQGKLKEVKEIKDEPHVKTVTYVQGCPIEGCKGLINKEKYKCSLCSKRICSKCRISIKSKKDLETHECKKEDLETVKLLKTDTKACPKCATNIYKISGCQQIFCVVCHIAFDWKTGKIETGIIHNPHYFEYLQNRGVSVHDNVECGDDIPRLNSYYNRMTTPSLVSKDGVKYTNHIRKKHIDIHFQLLSHVLVLATNRLQEFINSYTRENNELDYHRTTINYRLYKLRIKYIKNEISEKDWSKRVCNLYHEREKNNFCIEIYSSLRMILTESMKKLYNDLGEPIKTINNKSEYNKYVDEKNAIIKTFLDYIEDVRNYFNDCIIKEHSLYGNYKSFHVIGKLFEIMTYSDVEKGFIRPSYYRDNTQQPSYLVHGGNSRIIGGRLIEFIVDTPPRTPPHVEEISDDSTIEEESLNEILLDELLIEEDTPPHDKDESTFVEDFLDEELLEEDGESESECILVEE